MNLRSLQSLVAVAETGSFTRAAESLHLAQPAVSQHVKALERHLDVELIDRRTKRPTAAGMVVIERAASALAQIAAIPIDVAEIQDIQRGTVRAGAIHWLAPLDLPDLLRSFSQRYPGVSVELREENADDMFAMVESGSLDVVFSNIAPGDVTPPTLSRRHLFTEDLVVGTAPTHPLAGTTVELADLAAESFIAFRPGSAFRDTVTTALRNAGVEPDIVFESSDLITIRSLAASGLGIAFMPRSLVAAHGPRLGIVRIAPEPPRRTVALTWARTNPPSRAASAFIGFTHDWLDRSPVDGG